MSVRLVQFGDLHLDSPLEKLSPRLAARRRALSRRLVADVVALARDRRADLIVCTGDLFDSDTPYYDSVLAAAEAFARTDVPVFLAPGNHDFYAEPSPWTAAPWSSNVHIFRTVAPETVTLAGCSVTGVASTERRRSLAPLEGFRIPAFDGPKILIFHGDVGPGGPYSHATEEQLAATGADYVALGHVHKGFIRRAGNALLVMNGSAECRGFGESGEKGAVFAELGPEGARAELVPLGGSRCFETEAADLDGSAASLEAAVRAACPWPPERTLLDLTLTGGGAADQDELTALLCDFLSLRLTDRRERFVPPPERGLPALFARRAAALAEAETDPRRARLLAGALRFGLAAMRNGEPPRDPFAPLSGGDGASD